MDRPQKVTGPPAAAANSSTDAGAVPAPSSSSTVTNGISNSSGTLISTPSVAATMIPARLSPRNASTVSGRRNWMAAPDTRPAPTMIGHICSTMRPEARAQAGSPSASTCRQVAAGSGTDGGARSHSPPAARRPTTAATSGPSRNAAAAPKSSRLAPIEGEKITAIISSDGTLRTAEPCTSASAPSTPSPPRRTALETGTTQAEHRLTTGPMPSPVRMRRSRLRARTAGTCPMPTPGTRNASAMPAAAKANAMPIATRRR